MNDNSPLSLSDRPVLPRGVRLRHDHVRSRYVLLAPERIYEIDETGLDILTRCDGRSFGELLGSLSEAYDAPPEVLAEDVSAFLRDFITKRVVALA